MPRFCSIDGCHGRHLARGFCSKHYNRFKAHGDPNYVEVIRNGSKKDFPVEYRILTGIKDRCLNKKSKYYSRYGGRGIKVCDRWTGKYGATNFIKDMGPRPNSGYSIERIDNNGDYCPENCKWGTWDEQENNRRINVYYEYNGKKLTLRQWARELGISFSTLCNRRYKRHLLPPELFSPIDKRYSRPRNYITADEVLDDSDE